MINVDEEKLVLAKQDNETVEEFVARVNRELENAVDAESIIIHSEEMASGIDFSKVPSKKLDFLYIYGANVEEDSLVRLIQNQANSVAVQIDNGSIDGVQQLTTLGDQLYRVQLNNTEFTNSTLEELLAFSNEGGTITNARGHVASEVEERCELLRDYLSEEHVEEFKENFFHRFNKYSEKTVSEYVAY